MDELRKKREGFYYVIFFVLAGRTVLKKKVLIRKCGAIVSYTGFEHPIKTVPRLRHEEDTHRHVFVRFLCQGVPCCCVGMQFGRQLSRTGTTGEPDATRTNPHGPPAGIQSIPAMCVDWFSHPTLPSDPTTHPRNI